VRTLDRPPAPPVAPARRSRDRVRGAILALSGVEGRKLLRHPMVVAGALLSAVAFVVATKDRAPVLHRDDILTGAAALPLAAATLLAANLAALRSRRHGTDELFESTATPIAPRTIGHLVSLAWPAALALLLVGGALLYLVVLGAVGSPSAFELGTGPTIVVLAGALGILLARWWPSTAAGPVALVGLVALEVYFNLGLNHNLHSFFRIRWLGPWVELSTGDGNPARELVIRPAGWHLLYLLAAVAVLGSIALLRHGAGERRVIALAVASVTAVGTGWAQVRSPSEERVAELAALVQQPERFQVCEVDARVRFCAYPAYAPWIDRWEDVVRPVVDLVPPGALPVGLQVRQNIVFDAYDSDLPQKVIDQAQDPMSSLPVPTGSGPAVYTSAWRMRVEGEFTEWGREFGEEDEELALALGVSAWIVGLPGHHEPVILTRADVRQLLRSTPRAEREASKESIYAGALWYACDPGGQARTVVALWLAGRATLGTEAILRDRVTARPYQIEVVQSDDGVERFVRYHLDDLGGGVYWFATGDKVAWTVAEATYAVQLMDRPEAEVSAIIRRSWALLTDPQTPTEELVDLFHLEPLPSPEELFAGSGLTPDEVARMAQYSRGEAPPCR
jgi:hypothetical protein